MKNLVFLSSLNNNEQRGGAYLRVDSMVKVFSHWGILVKTLYQDQITVKGRFQKLLGSLRFGREVTALFSKARVNIPACDYLVLDNFRYLHWDLVFAKHGDKPLLIYNAHNLEFENYFGKADSFRRARFSKYEANRIEICDLILVCSEREREILIVLNPRLKNRIYVFPNLVDIRNYKVCAQKQSITFLGSLDYYPNIEAVKFICGYFLDHLPKELHSHIVIAGRNPGHEVVELCAQRGVQLLTNLSDSEISTLLAETKVSLVPLVSGSGTRLKIIESIFSHALVLATQMGSEGVDPAGLVISDLEDFPGECARLYLKKAFADICSDSRYNKYLETYDCYTWAKSHHEEFMMILNLNS